MPKYNLYRIPPANKTPLLQKLQTENLEPTKTIEVDGFELSFYLLREPKNSPVGWQALYKAFLQDESELTSQSHAAVLVLEGEGLVYAASLGKSHLYIKPYCDKDFGLNLAERIVNEDQLKLKSSNFFQSKRNKSVTSFKADNPMVVESGESIHFLKAMSVNEQLWGKSVSFGVSAQFSLKKDPSELPGLIRTLEAELSKDPILRLPRTELIKDEAALVALDQKLVEGILSETKANVEMEDFGIQGMEFVFHHADSFELHLHGNKKDTRLVVEELNLDTLIHFLEENEIDLSESLEKIRISALSEGKSSRAYKLKDLLDFTDEDGHCLLNGDWQKFNHSYVEYLEEMVDQIPLEYDPAQDVESGVIENTFIIRRKKEGYTSLHKEKRSIQLEKKMRRFSVEEMDLWKDKIMYCVKMGSTQKMAYVVDQAVNTVRLLQHGKLKIRYDNKEFPVKKVAVWMVLDRKGKVNVLSKLDSIILLMKLVDFRRVVLDAGMEPVVKINYRN